MSNVLQHQHQSMESAYDILENIKEMFGDQNRAATHTTMKALLNTKMVEVGKASPVALNFEIRSSSKLRGGQKKKKAQKPSVYGAIAGVKKPKGKCYHCKKPRHHKKQCPTYLAKLNNKSGDLQLLVVETFLAVVSTMSWCVDSGATNHVCTYLQGFR
nr:uncharacterized protein LOC104110340 [Nicotiana tomentosiformis]